MKLNAIKSITVIKSIVGLLIETRATIIFLVLWWDFTCGIFERRQFRKTGAFVIHFSSMNVAFGQWKCVLGSKKRSGSWLGSINDMRDHVMFIILDEQSKQPLHRSEWRPFCNCQMGCLIISYPKLKMHHPTHRKCPTR